MILLCEFFHKSEKLLKVKTSLRSEEVVHVVLIEVIKAGNGAA